MQQSNLNVNEKTKQINYYDTSAKYTSLSGSEFYRILLIVSDRNPTQICLGKKGEGGLFICSHNVAQESEKHLELEMQTTQEGLSFLLGSHTWLSLVEFSSVLLSPDSENSLCAVI